MGKNYNQLSLEERAVIAGLLREGMSVRGIAKELCRAPSTISREIRRNFPTDLKAGHLALRAERKADRRRRCSHKRPRLKNDFIRQYVREKLCLGWTPEQIAGRLKREHPTETTNHESIYLYLYFEARELLPLLPRSRKNRQRRTYTLKGKARKIANITSITERPGYIEHRKELGHWEVDTVYSSKGKSALLVLSERKSRYTTIAKLPCRTAKLTRRSIIKQLKTLPSTLRKTLTFDNGTENTEHLLIDKALSLQSYFCLPYHSWQKGTVENSIGILRRNFPKNTNFDHVSTHQISSFQRLLNNRPRKCLAFQTPSEVFNSSCCT